MDRRLFFQSLCTVAVLPLVKPKITAGVDVTAKGITISYSTTEFEMNAICKAVFIEKNALFLERYGIFERSLITLAKPLNINHARAILKDFKES